MRSQEEIDHLTREKQKAMLDIAKLVGLWSLRSFDCCTEWHRVNNKLQRYEAKYRLREGKYIETKVPKEGSMSYSGRLEFIGTIPQRTQGNFYSVLLTTDSEPENKIYRKSFNNKLGITRSSLPRYPELEAAFKAPDSKDRKGTSKELLDDFESIFRVAIKQNRKKLYDLSREGCRMSDGGREIVSNLLGKDRVNKIWVPENSQNGGYAGTPVWMMLGMP